MQYGSEVDIGMPVYMDDINAGIEEEELGQAPDYGNVEENKPPTDNAEVDESPADAEDRNTPCSPPFDVDDSSADFQHVPIPLFSRTRCVSIDVDGTMFCSC